MNVMIEMTSLQMNGGFIQINFNVWGETGIGPFNKEVLISPNSNASQINSAIIAGADSVMAENGFPMSPQDKRNVFGGACV